VHGKTRGHLSTEIENALREYRKPDNSGDSLTRIEDDIATIKAQLAAEADGGSVAAPPSEDCTRTHAANSTNEDDTNSKPPANAPRMEKVAYMVNTKFDSEGGIASYNSIIEMVQEEFHFEERTAEKFVQPIIDELDAKRHPNNNNAVLWGSRIEWAEEHLGDDDGDE